MANIVIVDKAASTPEDRTNQINIPISIVNVAEPKIAEFGLSVQQGEIHNFVELNGVVAVQSDVSTPSDQFEYILVRLRRRNTTTLPPEAEPGTIIFATRASLEGGGKIVSIGFSFTEGGVDGSIPSGYYSYTMHISRMVGLGPTVNAATAPFITGPIQFTGNSYIKNN